VIEAASPDGKSKLRVGVIGMLRYNPMFVRPMPGGGSMTIAHPGDRVPREVEALRAKQVDLVVVLAALHKDDAKRLAEAVPGIDFILGAYGGMVSAAAEKVGTTSIIYCGNQGQRVGETRVLLDKDGKVASDTTRMHHLTALYPTDPAMLEYVNSLELPKPAAPAAETLPGAAAK
jgi:2',3'-cyclic-nucleotide 2'-phosphodiesterase (5'-nucleotidase family)